jgi:hypothetical protein
MVFEHASVLDCSQNGTYPDPKSWILAWIMLSVISSLLYICILCTADQLKLLEIVTNKMKLRNSSLASFTVLTILTFVYYIIQIASEGTKGLTGAILFFQFFWLLEMWVVVYILNYTPPPAQSSQCVVKILRVIYWFALFMYLCEILLKLFAAMLDVAYDVAPVIERRFPHKFLKGLIVILSGLRLAYHSRLFYFFWDKMFHGNRDLFSEPSSKLKEATPAVTDAENRPETPSLVDV